MLSSASKIISNDDLLAGFLLYFPAKSLLKFQLVSKQWLSVISSPSFRRLHTLHLARRPNPPQPSFILHLNGTRNFLICNLTTRTLLPFSFGPLQSQYSHIDPLQSCNGLLLLECRVDSYSEDKHYHVFNHATSQSRNLALAKPFLRLCLIFDPSKSPYYRVVCFVKCTGSTLFTSVYDSVTHVWNDHETESTLRKEEVSNGIYWNDGIYFTKTHLGSQVFYREDGSVCRVANPSRVRPRGTNRLVCHTLKSNGHILYVRILLRPENNWLYVSELCEKSSDELSECVYQWSNVHLSYLSLRSEPYVDNYQIRLIGLVRGAGEEDSMVVFHMPGEILTYNFAAQTFETLIMFRKRGYYKPGLLQFQFEDSHQLVHTLAPV